MSSRISRKLLPSNSHKIRLKRRGPGRCLGHAPAIRVSTENRPIGTIDDYGGDGWEDAAAVWDKASI